VKLSCDLLRYSRENSPKPHAFETALNARKQRAISVFDKPNDQHVIFFALVQDQPVGFIRGHLYQPDLATDQGNHLMGHIDEIYIQQNVRGCSVGRKLVEKINDWMREQGAKQMTLEMYAWNDQAAAFYHKEGFEMVDVIFQRDVL
jgi:GNAT superfamily N-acetyltransferase